MGTFPRHVFGTPDAPVAAGESWAWLLELGAAARENQLRVQHRRARRRYVSAWSSHRAGAHARRLVIQQRLEATATPVVPPPSPPEESIDTALLDRISVYTHGEEALQLAHAAG